MDQEARKRLLDQEMVKLVRNSEEIVISGVGGRFPMSNSMDEFADNLYKNIDMITEDTECERWPNYLYGMNHRMGRIKDIDKFDGAFFGILAKSADSIDPASRMMMETTFEAIADAGIPPQSLRGSRTGVYVGNNTVGIVEHYPQEIQKDMRTSLVDAGIWLGASGKNMLANRISYIFDFHGPSMVIDTACSSSMAAFEVAVTDMRLGKVDQAVVACGQVNLSPYSNHHFQMTHANAPDGISKVWDRDADGFIRSETVACLFLQRKSQAKRIYATVVHAKTNVDGFKTSGNFFPSSEVQQQLLEETLLEANIDPNEINYFEAHATGTRVGDPQEAKAIAGVYCKGRKEQLLVGLLKSVIGHGEGTSGVAAICRTIISFENKCISANLNLNNLKQEIAVFCPPLKPVLANTPFEPKYAAINCFGLGGVNGHAILKVNQKEVPQELVVDDDMPRLVNACGRTPEGLDHIFEWIQKNPKKVTADFLALLNEMSKMKPKVSYVGFPYRGSMLIKKKRDENGMENLEYQKESSILIGARPVWFFFSGMGSQWVGMAKALMVFKTFAKSIAKCAAILEPHGVNLLKMITSDDPDSLNSIVNPFVAITSVQVALFDVLTELGIHPDGIIGHSFGEIACAYADGCLTLEQAVLCSFWRGKVVADGNIPDGAMIAVGLSAEEARKRCPKNVFVACDNASDSVTISGLEADVKKFAEKLKADNVFVREVAGYRLKPYHSNVLNPLADVLTKILSRVIPEPKKRSEKWYSTSVPSSDWKEDPAKYASAEYFVNNLIKPVLFTDTLKYAPADVVVIEVAPHALFASLIKRSLENASYIGLAKRNNNDQNVELFLQSLGKLYQLGLNPDIEKLYAPVQWPVARGTQSLSSLIKWDHAQSFFVKLWPEYWFHSTASDMKFKYSLENHDDLFLKDHKVDGRILFPAAGFLTLAWRRLAGAKALPWTSVPICFEDVRIHRPVMFEDNEVKLVVRYLEPSGQFLVVHEGNVCVTGKMYVPEDGQTLVLQHLIKEHGKSEGIGLSEEEFYRELRIRGYDYGPFFQGVVESKFVDMKRVEGQLKWASNTNPITFFDTILQLLVNSIPIRSLFIPIGFQSMRIDPQELFSAVDELKIDQKDTKEQEENPETSAYSNLKYIAEQEVSHDRIMKNMDAFKTDLETDLHEIQEQTGGGVQKWVAHLPVVIDSHLSAVVTRGVEVRGLLPVNIPRRPQTNGLRLEKYEFVPYEETGAIEECDRKELSDYIELCAGTCLQLVKDAKLKLRTDWLANINNHVPFDLKRYQQLTNDIREDHVMLKLIHGLYQSTVDVNENVLDSQQLMAKLKEDLKKPEFDLTKDVINLVGRNERLIRPLLDLVNENCLPSKELRVVEVNLSKGFVGVDVADWQVETVITPMQIDYSIANDQPESLQEDQELKKLGFKFVKWTGKEAAFPDQVTGVDLILHRDVFDLWLIDLKQYLTAAHDAIKDNGFLLGVFRTKMTLPELILSDMIDNGKPPIEQQMANRIKQFEKTAEECGFNVISRRADKVLFDAVLFRKVNKEIDPQQQAIVHIKKKGEEEWLNVLQTKMEEFKNKPKGQNIWMVAEDNDNGVLGLLQCLRSESGGEKLRCLFNQDNKFKKPVDFKNSEFKKILENDLIQNVFKDNKFGSMRHLNLPKDFDQTPTHRAYVNVQQRGDLSSLQWFDGRNLKLPVTVAKDIQNEVKQVECDVYYSALNFRDVMMATGRIQPGPEGAIMDCLLGYEFAGRRKDTGQRVFGMTVSYGIADTVSTTTPCIFDVPDDWSMAEASTVCVVYMTVWYGLIERGKILPGEAILIHSAAGGVGQAAIRVCQDIGCKIFVTVGGQEKREFLKEKYGLKDEQMFNSRTTDFESQVLEATQGKGVDLVLNSLAEDKLLASFRCLGNEGRFIEIGKYDAQMNNPLPMFAFLKNISFHGVHLDKIALLEKRAHLILLQKFKEWSVDAMKKGVVKPLNYNVFAKEQVKDAFKYMMTGKHMGKVLLKVRDEESDRRPLIASPVKTIATGKTWFAEDKVYIIVGGLGGMGLEMVYWMMLRGAKKLVLTSRSGIKTSSQKLFFRHLDELGKAMEALAVKITISNETAVTMESAQRLIAAAEADGPIGGIFQLAVVLHDDLFENQTPDSFRSVCESKVDITENLDNITQNQLKYPLDFFVAFSSMSCGRGNNGQSPYGYACSVMERICERRRRAGHHGLAIQWGPIGDVGVLIDTQSEEKLKMAGLILQRTPSWLYALDKFLGQPCPVVASAIRAERQVKSGSHVENMVKQLWSSMGVDPKTVPNHVSLGELGMESFVAIEFQQRMEKDYDISLSINEIKRVTVGEIKEFEAGNKESLKEYSIDIKEMRTKLSKIKFMLPGENVTRLNDITEGTPVYFLPTGEGMFTNVMPLVEKLPFPVYGLNWTPEVEQMKSIKEMASHYMKVLKTMVPKGNYILLSYFFGSVIAMKMLIKKAPVKKLFIVDAFSSKKMNTEMESLKDDEEFDQIFRLFGTPTSLRNRIKRKVLEVRDEEKRIKLFIEMIKDFGGRHLIGNDLDTIVYGAVDKRKKFNKFRNKMFKKLQKFKSFPGAGSMLALKSFSSDVVIVKASENLEDRKQLEEDLLTTYGLKAEIIEGQFHLELIEGSPDDLLSELLPKTADIIINNNNL